LRATLPLSPVLFSLSALLCFSRKVVIFVFAAAAGNVAI
jgi:hypothetical protein